MNIISLNLYNSALYSLLGLSFLIAGSLFFINAPYGRYISTKWGPLIPSKWGWVIMETPAVLIIMAFFITGNHSVSGLVFLIMWQSHYIYRTYIFPFRLKVSKKSMPVSIIMMAIIFNFWNGYLNGVWLFHLAPQKGIEWLFSWPFITGFLIFYLGMYINRQSDKILFNLRKDGETGYKIPYGGMYKYVSMPSYLGETIQWAGFALATFSMSGLTFTIFTLANLLPRAVSNHKWYKRTFDNYPEKRKAIIPFII